MTANGEPKELRPLRGSVHGAGHRERVKSPGPRRGRAAWAGSPDITGGLFTRTPVRALADQVVTPFELDRVRRGLREVGKGRDGPELEGGSIEFEKDGAVAAMATLTGDGGFKLLKP